MIDRETDLVSNGKLGSMIEHTLALVIQVLLSFGAFLVSGVTPPTLPLAPQVQLRGAYLGVNNAIRATGLRDSQLTGDPDDMSEIGEMQNLLELHVSDATVFVSWAPGGER